MKLRHPNRPNAHKPTPRSFRRRNRCSCKPNKVGWDHQFRDRERMLRQG